LRVACSGVSNNDIEFMAEIGELGRFEDPCIISDDFKMTPKVG